MKSWQPVSLAKNKNYVEGILISEFMNSEIRITFTKSDEEVHISEFMDSEIKITSAFFARLSGFHFEKPLLECWILP